MSVSFKNFKHYPSMSEETVCFEATVFFEGKRIGTVNNRGCGGQAHFREDVEADKALVSRASEWAKAFVPMKNGEPEFLDDEKTLPWRMDSLDDYCDYLAGREAERKNIEKQYNRNAKNQTLFVAPEKGPGVFIMKNPYSPNVAQHILKLYPKATVLNALSKPEAIALFVKADEESRAADLAAAQQQAATKTAPKPR